MSTYFFQQVESEGFELKISGFSDLAVVHNSK
jgi:hypothetical protein